MCLLVQSQPDQQVDDESNQINATESPLMTKNFFRKFFKNFQSLESLFLNTLDELNQSYRIEKFLKCLLTRLLELAVEFDTDNVTKLSVNLDRNDDEEELNANERNSFFQLLVKLLNKFNLNHAPNLVEHLITTSFCLLVKQLEHNKLPNLYVEYHLCEVIFKLECKYPILFDKCLSAYLDLSNQELSKRGKAYLLNTISFKFSSFKCRHTFKYQQLESCEELNLIQSLSHSNSVIRSNALNFLNVELTNKAGTRFKFDSEFLRNEFDSKFKHESSPIVCNQLVKLGCKLLDYFSLVELLEDDDRLLGFFRTRANSDAEWIGCRMDAIDLIFEEMYLKNSEKKEEFFDALLKLETCLFLLESTTTPILIEKLKKTAFYAHIQSESHANTEVGSSPIKKFVICAIAPKHYFLIYFICRLFSSEVQIWYM